MQADLTYVPTEWINIKKAIQQYSKFKQNETEIEKRHVCLHLVPTQGMCFNYKSFSKNKS